MTKELLASENYYDDFKNLLDPREGEKRAWESIESKEYLPHLWEILAKESQQTTIETATLAYPGQGLLTTPYDHLDAIGVKKLDDEMVKRALGFRQWWLLVANHPARLEWLKGLADQEFIPPPPVESIAMEKALSKGMVLAPGDLGGLPMEVGNGRVSRRELLATAPFIKLGKQPRLPFIGSAMTDCWGSILAVGTMAASHCLCGLPRNGVSRIAAGGNLEAPGGWLYFVGADGKPFEPYGGEASARIKFQEGKMYPFGVSSFVEGETSKAYLGFVDGLPTIALNLLRLSENLNLALSFRNVTTVTALQALNPSPLRRQTNEGEKLQRPH